MSKGISGYIRIEAEFLRNILAAKGEQRISAAELIKTFFVEGFKDPCNRAVFKAIRNLPGQLAGSSTMNSRNRLRQPIRQPVKRRHFDQALP